MSTQSVLKPNSGGPAVNLPPMVAFWVLGAHVYALLVPLVLLIVIAGNSELVAARTDYPSLFTLAVLLMMLGSAFEIIQNHNDGWYLTPDTASADGESSVDMLFYSFIALSQAVVVIACVGKTGWVSLPALVLALSQPFFYATRRFAMLPLAVVGLISGVVTFQTFAEPVLLLQLGLPMVTAFFFGLLLKTGNQLLHACTALAASSGVLIFAWGIYRAGVEAANGWGLAVGMAVFVALLLAAVRPLLASLPSTPARTTDPAE